MLSSCLFHGGLSFLLFLFYMEPLSFIMELTPFTPCSRSDFLFPNVQLLSTLTRFHLTISRFEQMTLPFFFCESRLCFFVNCSICSAEAILSYSTDQVYSSFSAEGCAILLALRWPRQLQISHINSPPFNLILCSCYTFLTFLLFSGTTYRN